MKNKTITLTLLTALSTSVYGDTFTLDFNTDDAGVSIVAGDGSLGSGYDFNTEQPYANIYGGGQGVTFTSAVQLTVYDTDFGGTDLSIVGADNDLEPEYEGGNNVANLGANHNFGNALIIQEAAIDIDTPNDEGGGGTYTLTSSLGLTAIEFDLIDFDAPGGVSLTFSDASGESVVIDFADFEDGSGSVFEVSNVEFGDRHSNNIDTVTLANLQTINADITEFTKVVFTSNRSGAFGDIELTTVPEPTSSLLVGLGFITLAFRRNR